MFEYDKIMKLSVLEAIREILRMTAKHGLPVEGNHFYISFSTDFHGVVIPSFLKEKYPKEMTIVLQNSFSNLKVDEGSLDNACFSVDLKFSGITSTVTVPFKAIKSFKDPLTYFSMSLDFPDSDKNEKDSSKSLEKKSNIKQDEKKSEGIIIDFNSFKKK